MRKVLMFLLIVQTLSIAEDLTPEQQRMYIQNCLTVEPVIISYGGSSFGFGQTSSYGSHWGRSETDWQVTKGLYRISKYDFMKITGYDKEAESYAKAEMANKTNKKMAYLIGTAGFCLLTVGTIQLINGNDNFMTFAFNYGFGGALLASGVGMSTITIVPDVAITYEKAKMMADEYNEKLKKSILEGRLKAKP